MKYSQGILDLVIYFQLRANFCFSFKLKVHPKYQFVFIQIILKKYMIHKRCVFIVDGRRLMTCGEDQYLKVLDLRTGSEVYSKDTGHSLM